MTRLFDGKGIFTAVATFSLGAVFGSYMGIEPRPVETADVPTIKVQLEPDCTFVGVDLHDGSGLEKILIWRELDRIRGALKKAPTEGERAQLELLEARLRAKLRLLELRDRFKESRDFPDEGTTKLVYREICYEN